MDILSGPVRHFLMISEVEETREMHKLWVNGIPAETKNTASNAVHVIGGPIVRNLQVNKGRLSSCVNCPTMSYATPTDAKFLAAIGSCR